VTDLVERETTLGLLRRCLHEAGQSGRVALVAGEAGIGKTSVLRAIAREHGERAPVWWGACDALETPHPLAPLLDIARENRTRFAAALQGPRPALFEAVLDELRLAPAPVLVVIEDAHWADDATLDLLKFVGRRIERAKAVLAISYRDDEVGVSHPLRRVLGELPPAQRTLVEVPRLTADGVKALAQRFGGKADGVYEATRGNAFFVTEVLRDTSVPRAAVPRSVQDVVLARFARLADGEPEKGLATESDDMPAMPAVDQQLAHQRLEAALHRHGPGLVADGLVRHGVDPEVVPAQRPSRLEVRHLCAVQVAIEHAPDDLSAGADEGLAVTHFLAARVAAEEAERRIGITEADDRLQRITVVGCIDRRIDAVGVGGEVTQRLAQRCRHAVQ
jgi:hypothetical protein